MWLATIWLARTKTIKLGTLILVLKLLNALRLDRNPGLTSSKTMALLTSFLRHGTSSLNVYHPALASHSLSDLNLKSGLAVDSGISVSPFSPALPLKLTKSELCQPLTITQAASIVLVLSTLFSLNPPNPMARAYTVSIAHIALHIRTHSIQGFQAGRIRAIFELPHHLSIQVTNEKLAYLECFRPFSASAPKPLSLYSTSHLMVNNRRQALVVPLSYLRMVCHLTPRYHLMDPEHHISSSTDLLAVCSRFHLNKYCSHFMFVVLEHWRKRVQVG
jgi:hypothetical protein